MLKSDIWAATEVCVGATLFAALARTAPPLKVAAFPLLLAVGVNTIVIVAVDPDCNCGIVQETLVEIEPPEHCPEVALAETKVRGTIVVVGLRSSVTVMVFAGSGPLLVNV
jgi:hypothetical protein